MDTLEVQLDYLYTDTLNRLVPKTDTIYLANKLTREQREKLQKKANEEKEKERKKRGEKGDTIRVKPNESDYERRCSVSIRYIQEYLSIF